MAQTTKIDERDKKILAFIAARGEVFFKELNEANLMAKSTLSKHLRSLRKGELIDKAISKKRLLGPRDTVYILTTKGKKMYREEIAGNPIPFEYFF